jgi:hypothetical protein
MEYQRNKRKRHTAMDGTGTSEWRGDYVDIRGRRLGFGNDNIRECTSLVSDTWPNCRFRRKLLQAYFRMHIFLTMESSSPPLSVEKPPKSVISRLDVILIGSRG